MFTKKVKHTLKILMALAREREGEGRLLRIEDFAERTGVPRNYVYELILNIREAGIIASVHGRTGGYRLVKEPADVSIPELLRLLGEPIAPLPCLTFRTETHRPEYADQEICRVREGLMKALDEYIQQVDSLSLADFLGPDDEAAQVLAEA